MVGEATRARVTTSSGAGPSEAAGAPGSGKPRANPNLAPRGVAKTRVGCSCRAPAMANGQCRIHGGTSTGPRTAAELANLAAARTTSGDYSAASWASDRYRRTLAVRLRLRVAARQLQAFLPPDVAAQLVAVPAELSAPVRYSQIAKPEIATKTLTSGESDAPGRFTASARTAPRGRAAELEAARADRAAFVPWRAAIAGARLARREALAARRAARIENHDKNRMERLAGACLGGLAAGTRRRWGGGDGAGRGAGKAGAWAWEWRDARVGWGAAGGGHGIGKIVQRPSGQAPEGMPCEAEAGGGRGTEGADVGGSTLAIIASRHDARVQVPHRVKRPAAGSGRLQWGKPCSAPRGPGARMAGGVRGRRRAGTGEKRKRRQGLYGPANDAPAL
jgi:hypothetical protein